MVLVSFLWETGGDKKFQGKFKESIFEVRDNLENRLKYTQNQIYSVIFQISIIDILKKNIKVDFSGNPF